MRSPKNPKLEPTRTPQPRRPWSHAVEPEVQANQAAHSFTFIFRLPCRSPEEDLRCLLALAGRYKPPAQTSLQGRDQIPRAGTASLPHEAVRERQVWGLSASVVCGLWSSLSLPPISSHAHNRSEVITVPPFSRVPRSPYLMLPSWELRECDRSPLPPVGQTSWRDGPWGLTLC